MPTTFSVASQRPKIHVLCREYLLCYSKSLSVYAVSISVVRVCIFVVNVWSDGWAQMIMRHHLAFGSIAREKVKFVDPHLCLCFMVSFDNYLAFSYSDKCRRERSSV